MVVLGLIMTTAFGALRVGEQSWEAGLQRSNNTEQLRMVADLLRRQFAQILSLTWAENAEPRIAFHGAPDLVQFVAPAPQHHGATGLFEFTVAVEPFASGTRLTMYYRVIDPDHDGLLPPRDGERVVLADQLRHATISYYGATSADDRPTWHRDWGSDAEQFPQLVRIELESDDERRQWPPLNLALGTGPQQ
jgi:hypothetical protein